MTTALPDGPPDGKPHGLEMSGPPKSPVTVSREELYRQVWETPMSRLAQQYGLSDNGLAKICNRINVPYPPRGYWAKKTAGKKVVQQQLPEWKNGVARAASIVPTPPRALPPEVPPEIKRQVEAVVRGTAIVVPERLTRPHRIIAGWLADHEQERLAARRERNPNTRTILQAMLSPDWTECDHRRHRILDALFKAAEKQGLKVTEEKKRRLCFESEGERIVCNLYEKQRRVLRPQTAEERRLSGGRGWTNLEATGLLLFSIETYLPSPSQRVWTETPTRPMEGMVGDILAGLLLAGPILAQRQRDRDEERRRWQEEEHRRRQEVERKRQDDNRWRRFIELAEMRRQADDARRFLAAMDLHPEQSEARLDGKTISDWLVWARDRLAAFDSLTSGPQAVFGDILKVTASTYRD